MVHHMRSKWLAGTGALLLALSMTGLAAAATFVDDITPATVATFEDLNGNGIDDDCETAVVASADAATAALTVVDANADGTISTTEAAHSDRVGGTNCNHGGYVSTIAGSTADACDEADAPETTAADCSEDAPAADEAADDDAARAACEAALAAGTPVVLPVMTHVELAQSDAVGGKNCNHGGAVSDANKAAKTERDAAKLAARESRLAAHAAKSHGKHGKHGQN
jgi:hypothetical protein